MATKTKKTTKAKVKPKGKALPKKNSKQKNDKEVLAFMKSDFAERMVEYIKAGHILFSNMNQEFGSKIVFQNLVYVIHALTTEFSHDQILALIDSIIKTKAKFDQIVGKAEA